jgi:hypothetical protein
MRKLGYILRLVVIGGLCMLTSGCFFNALLSRIEVVSAGELVSTILDVVFSGGTGAVCYSIAGSSDCTYVINGQPVGSSLAFAGQGSVGALIDPVIMQVPSAATAFSGTFTGPGGTTNLTITQVVGSLPADLNTSIIAEPGTKLVIVDFPADPPTNQTYSFALHFELPGNVATIPVKALAAAKLTSNGQTFYPPLMPCETNFANIPGVNLTQSAAFQPVVMPSAVGRGCVNKIYQFAAAPGPGPQGIPATGKWGALLLAALVGTLGVFWTRRRRA